MDPEKASVTKVEAQSNMRDIILRHMMIGKNTHTRPPFVYSTWGGVTTFALLLVVAVVLKGAKLCSLETDISFWHWLRLFFADAGLAAGTTLAAGLVGLGLRRWRWGGWLTHGLLSLWLVALQGLAAIEHGSWESTGTLIDWNILEYTLRHFSELSSAVGSEMSSGNQLFIAGMLTMGLLPLAVDVVLQYLPRIRWQFGKLSLGALGVGMVMIFLLSLIPLPDQLAPLGHNAPGSLALGAISRLLGQGDDAVEEGVVPEDGVSETAGNMKWQEQIMADAAKVRWREAGKKPLNILFVVFESARFSATTPYNSKLESTPLMARLGADGVLVERVYTDVPHTSKALVGFLCGYAPRYTFEIHEAQTHGLPRPCLAHYLRHLGYRTGFFQAAGGSFENRRQLVDNMGYHDFFSKESYNTLGFEKTNYLGIEDGVMLQPALDWVDEDPGTPFFLTFMTIISHHNYGLPSGWKKKKLAQKGQSKKFNRYLNTLRYIDTFSAKFLTGLRERGMLDNTLVVMFGDHGQGFKEHGRKHHNDVIYEEGLRVPLVFSNAMLFKKGRRVGGLRRLADVPPTVLSLIGAEYPEETFEGQDLLATEGHERVYSSCWYKHRCASEISGWIKVINHFEQRGMEVFDLENDPEEKRNLLELPGDEGARWKEQAQEARSRMEDYAGQIDQRFRLANSKRTAPFKLAEQPQPDFQVRARFGELVELLGYDLASTQAAPGSSVDATVYFKCLKPSEPGWKLLGHLQTEDSQNHKSDHHPAGGRLKLEECEAGTFVADRLRLWIPPNFPRGKATYYWGVYKKKKRQTVTALSPGLTASKDRLPLFEIEVAGQHPPTLQRFLEDSVSSQPFPVDRRLNVRFGDSLVLEGVTLEPANRVRRRNSLVVSTVWRVEKALEGSWRMFMHLHPKEGKMRRQDHWPVRGMLPVHRWEAGTWVRDQHTIFISPRWAKGKATLWGGLFKDKDRLEITDPGEAEVDSGGRVKLGTFRITR